MELAARDEFERGTIYLYERSSIPEEDNGAPFRILRLTEERNSYFIRKCVYVCAVKGSREMFSDLRFKYVTWASILPDVRQIFSEVSFRAKIDFRHTRNREFVQW